MARKRYANMSYGQPKNGIFGPQKKRLPQIHPRGVLVMMWMAKSGVPVNDSGDELADLADEPPYRQDREATIFEVHVLSSMMILADLSCAIHSLLITRGSRSCSESRFVCTFELLGLGACNGPRAARLRKHHLFDRWLWLSRVLQKRYNTEIESTSQTAPVLDTLQKKTQGQIYVYGSQDGRSARPDSGVRPKFTADYKRHREEAIATGIDRAKGQHRG